MILWAQCYEMAMDMLRHRFTTSVLHLMFSLGFGGWVVHWVAP